MGIQSLDLHPIIDKKILDTFYSGNEALLTKMLGVFLENTPINLKSCETSAKSGDPEAFKAAIHKIKSTFPLVGLPHLEKICKEIEKVALECSNKENLIKFNKLKRELDKCYPIMVSEYEKLSIIQATK